KRGPPPPRRPVRNLQAECSSTRPPTRAIIMPNALNSIFLQEDLNFLLTNRIPRALVTRFFGWFGKIENPLVRDLSIGVWRLFADVDLSEAEQTKFLSLHDCFIRKLKDGARPIDPDPAVLTSPCDAIVGASGKIEGDQLIQAKGLTYTLSDLLHDP